MTEMDIMRFKNKIAKWLEQEYGLECATSFSGNSIYIVKSSFKDEDGVTHSVDVMVIIRAMQFVYTVDNTLVKIFNADDKVIFGNWLRDLDWAEEYSTCLRSYREYMAKEKGE